MHTATATLSEHDSLAMLAAYGVPVAPAHLAETPEGAAAATVGLEGPFAVKLCGAGIAHKTERGLVRLAVPATGVEAAAAELLGAAGPDDGKVAVLVSQMVQGKRELIAGVVDDPTFGRCVMLGIGGVFAEALADVAFRLVPLSRPDALDMLDSLAHQSLLDAFRGEPAADRGAIADVLCALSRLAESEPGVLAVDVNPLILRDGHPVAVDGLVEVAQ